jgi:AcrR family transcriptional regulator
VKHEHQRGIDGKERLLLEARSLFLERGYAEVSMQEIATAADMTKGAPYYHFRDKEDLFVQVFLREMQGMTTLLSERLAGATTFRGRLLAITTLAVESGRSSFGQLVAELERHVSPERRRQLKRDCPPPTNEIRAIFDQAARDGDLARVDAATAYAVFIAILIGQGEISRTEPEMQEVVGWEAAASPEEIVDLFLNGV